VVDDAVGEFTESFNFILTNASLMSISNNTAAGTIMDDDVNTVPVITEESVSLMDYVSNSVTFSGIATNQATNIGLPEVYIISNNITNFINSSNNWSYLFDSTVYADGSNSLTFIAVDIYTNITVTNVNFLIDNNPPVISIDNIDANQEIYDIYTIEGSAYDMGSGLSNVIIILSNSNTGMVSTVSPDSIDSSGNWSYAMDTSIFSNGSYFMQIRGIDNAGYVSNSAFIPYYINNFIPDPVVPNPVPPEATVVPIAQLPRNCVIEIYNIAQDLITRFAASEYTEWNMRNKDGRKVAGGVYVMLVKDKNTGKEKKIIFTVLK
ncbi:MAG TPA: hypothetical protein VKS21_02220, partial [Spirochaetota bacterium]|nr:hypothetical protein [Spirochaetota bacterium]